MLRSPRFTRLAPRCCVIPPRSPAATVVFRSASRRLVFPWSTCPMTVTIGARVSSAAVADSSKRICLVAAGGASGASVGASSTSSGSGSATLNPSSVAISAAVSRSIPWFMVAKTPLRIRGLMMSAGLTRRICASSPTVIDGGSTRIPVSCTCSGFGGRGSGFARSGRTGRTLLLCFVMLPSFRSLSLSRRDAPDRSHQPLHRLPGHAGPDGSLHEGQPHASHYRSTLRVRHALQYAAHRLRRD